MSPDIELIADGLEFPEGPAFDADGTLYVVQLRNGWIARITDGGWEKYVDTGSRNNGSAFDESNALWIAAAGTNQLLRYDGQELVEIAGECDGSPLQSPNDLVFHPDGSIFMTGPGGSSADTPIGVIYHVTRDGEIRVVADGLAFPNGLALNEDASLLYLVEERRYQILAFDVRDDGTLGKPQLFAHMSGGAGGDGMALDAEGNLYIAACGAGEIVVLDAGGTRIDAFPTIGQKPTNLAFGGDDMRDLYITEVETGAVYHMRPGPEGRMPFCDPRAASG
ncbi:MAG: SMP-30/gluconolactonase/LRE family protein [Armatimonadota bacterium]|jgi:gluconolactonase